MGKNASRTFTFRERGEHYNFDLYVRRELGITTITSKSSMQVCGRRVLEN
jgi:hypothetical protein